MMHIRKSHERGKSQLDWLDSYHTFSFADYYDPDFMGFSVLRVINQDIVQPSHGFDRHPHKNMEIITYIISGELKHEDSIGNGSVIRSREIQRMTAGTGVKHSEYNHSEKNPVHLLQIWIKPNQLNLTPSYEQKTIPDIKNELILIGSSESTKHGVMIHQDIKLYAAYLTKNKTIHHTSNVHRAIWIQLISGTLESDSHQLEPGDGIAIHSASAIDLKSLTDNTEFLLFDLPKEP